MTPTKPTIIFGGSHTDARGTIAFVNDFHFEGVNSFYTIQTPPPSAPGKVTHKNSRTPGMKKRSELHDVGGINPELQVPRAERFGKQNDSVLKTPFEQSYFDINLGLTQKIFDYFLQSDARKFILFSSVKAAADTITGDYLTEEIPPNPKTPYGQSKLAAEQYITVRYASWNKDQPKATNHQPPKTNHQRPTTKNQPPPTTNHQPPPRKPSGTNHQPPKTIYIFRPAMIHGPGNKGNLNLLYNVVAKGIPWPLGAFHNQRSLVSINNLTYIIQQFIEKDIPSGTYNIADDYPVSTNEIIQLMARSMNKNTGIWKLPKPALQHIARLGDLLHLPLNSERLKKLTESYIVSNQKLKNTLQIQNLPINPKDGLLKTFESFNKRTK